MSLFYDLPTDMLSGMVLGLLCAMVGFLAGVIYMLWTWNNFPDDGPDDGGPPLPPPPFLDDEPLFPPREWEDDQWPVSR